MPLHTVAVGVDIGPDKTYTIAPHSLSKVSTIKWSDISPTNKYWGLVTLRSSYQSSGLIMPAIGIVDPDYRGYIFVTVYNITDKPITIKAHEKFAQVVLIPYNEMSIIVDLLGDIERGQQETEKGIESRLEELDIRIRELEDKYEEITRSL
ncbi:MAG: hypothetical protein N2V78_09200 [Methanophagales archaeon]|nr:hypothetical protein [Methanophagales archaeon]